MAEEPPGESCSADGNDEGEDKAKGFLLHAVDKVHTEERRDERGEHHDDGDAGERSHDGVHVVVDDALIGIHRRLKDVGVDARRLAGLRHLDADVLDEVGIKFVNL